MFDKSDDGEHGSFFSMRTGHQNQGQMRGGGGGGFQHSRTHGGGGGGMNTNSMKANNTAAGTPRGGGGMNVDLMNTRRVLGQVASYNLDKEYGFIRTSAPAANGQDVMFHRNALPGQFFNAHGSDLQGKELMFDLVVNKSNGKLRADKMQATNIPTYRSRVKLYMPEKGFGFLSLPSGDQGFQSMSLKNGKDIYFKQEEIVVNDKVVRDRALITNTKTIEGKEVCYSIKETPDGPHAMFVRIIEDDDHGPRGGNNHNHNQGGNNVNMGGQGGNNQGMRGGGARGGGGGDQAQRGGAGGGGAGTGTSNFARKREREEDLMRGQPGPADKRSKINGPPGDYLPEEEERLKKLLGTTFRAKVKSWIPSAYGFLVCPAITNIMSGANRKKDIWVKAHADEEAFRMGDWVQFTVRSCFGGVLLVVLYWVILGLVELDQIKVKLIRITIK